MTAMAALACTYGVRVGFPRRIPPDALARLCWDWDSSIVLAALRSTNLASAAHDTCILSTDLPESLPSRSKSSSTSIIAISFGGVFDGAYELQYTCKLNTLPPLPPNRASPGSGLRASGKRSQYLPCSGQSTSLLALSDHRRQCVGGPGAHEPIDGPLVLLAYKERDLGERQLWDMLVHETGVVLECIGKQAGAGGLPVKIWLGKKALTHLFTGHATASRS
ncbi:hypothetical protein BGW80DRAFT_1460385 [Lactifluus volemus]|nr:hypothetical protein BGW80DRAFT_1460385 [Lactifluus volemus]